MKKGILTLFFAAAFTTLSAQTEPVKTNDSEFNKWSVELAGGLNKPQRPMTARYNTATPSPFVADLGVRYMFNNKFGLKADVGYNSFTEKSGSAPFDTRYYRVDLQGVANLGRIMSFESWTSKIGLLGHAGFGAAQLESQNSSVKDKMLNFIAGVTGQIKLSDRIALTGDFSTILNASQNYAFDARSTSSSRGFSGILFNGTVGLTVYLGKNDKHADWVTMVNKDVLALTGRVDNLETMLIDTDQDGVADYLDLEKNTVSGVMVDSKGRAIDLNNNKVPDELETYLLANYVNKNDKSGSFNNNEAVKSLINGGYVATYFDFDNATPSNVSTEGIGFILTYLRANPSSSVEITGYADEVGQSAYNDKLSSTRAENVKTILMKANIDANRLNIVAAGEDNSVQKDSEMARKLVRKVIFKIK